MSNELAREYTSPEEKYNQELWWLLQEIKTEQLRTVAGKKIEFFFRDNKTLSKDIQEKLFYKLNSEGRLELERIGIPLVLVSGRRVFHDTLNHFTGEESYTSPSPLMGLVGFSLTIHQERFDELYRSLEQALIDKPVQPAQVEVETGKEEELTYTWDIDRENKVVKCNNTPSKLTPILFAIFNSLYNEEGIPIPLKKLCKAIKKELGHGVYGRDAVRDYIGDLKNTLSKDLEISRKLMEKIIEKNPPTGKIKTVTFYKNP